MNLVILFEDKSTRDLKQNKIPPKKPLKENKETGKNKETKDTSANGVSG